MYVRMYAIEYNVATVYEKYYFIETFNSRRRIKVWKTHEYTVLVFLQVTGVWICWRFRDRNGIPITWWSHLENIYWGILWKGYLGFYLNKNVILVILDLFYKWCININFHHIPIWYLLYFVGANPVYTGIIIRNSQLIYNGE